MKPKPTKPTYRVGEHTITLSPPGDFSIRMDIRLAEDDNRLRARAAALGACWRGTGAPEVNYARCNYSALLYGGEVLNALQARGVPMSEIIDVGGVALGLILNAGTPTSKGVEVAEDFSEAPEAP